MAINGTAGIFFWGFLLLFGVVMYALAPAAHEPAGFFRAVRSDGRPASQWALTASIFIAWIFAKSVTNAANLGPPTASSAAWPTPPTGSPFRWPDW